MNRNQLRTLIAELKERYPEVDFELRPRLAVSSSLVGAHYQVDVTVRVTQPLYFNPRDEMSNENLRPLVEGELRILRESTSERALTGARQTYLRRESRHDPVADQLLLAPLAVPTLGMWQPEPDMNFLWHAVDRAARTPFAIPIQSVAPIAPTEPRRPHLMLRPPVTVPIGPDMPRRSVIRDPVPPPADRAAAPEPATLWEHLEEHT
jgi:hypothetical protein